MIAVNGEYGHGNIVVRTVEVGNRESMNNHKEKEQIAAGMYLRYHLLNCDLSNAQNLNLFRIP